MDKKQWTQISVFLVIAVAALLLTAASQNATYTVYIPGALGTDSEISVTTSKNGNVILQKCRDYVYTMDNLFSEDKPKSDISKINLAAGTGRPVEVEADTARILARAKEYAVETNGFFDVTVGNLVDLWDQAKEEAVLPSPDAVSEAIHTVDFKSLRVDPDKNTVELEKRGQKVTLGGIAKGYITDGLVAMLKAEEVESALINLGGNAYALGKKNEFAYWKIGIQDPRNENKLLGSVQVENQCVVTSGDYQRYFEIDGVRYHHIMNPNTGTPSNSGLKSVTIIADDSTLADALSTACFVLGYSEGANLVREYENVSAIFVMDSNTVYYSPALEDSFEHDNPSYEYKVMH